MEPNSTTGEQTDPLDANPFDEGTESPMEETPVTEDDKHEEVETSEEASTEEKSTEESTEEPNTTSKFDEDLDSWAEKTHRPVPTTDEARQVLQDLRDSQRQYTKEQQARKASKDFASTAEKLKEDLPASEEEALDPLEKEVADLKRQNLEEKTSRLQSEFYQEHKITEETSSIMSTILTQKVDKASEKDKVKVLEYWSDPAQLPDLLELAEARQARSNKDVVAEEAAKKERERIAQASKAGGVVRNAKTSAETAKPDELMELWKK